MNQYVLGLRKIDNDISQNRVVGRAKKMILTNLKAWLECHLKNIWTFLSVVKVFIFTHFPKGQGTEGTGLPDPWPGAWKNWQDPLAILQAEIRKNICFIRKYPLHG